MARELIRIVQDTRKQAGLEVSDRIALMIEGGPGVAAAVAEHRNTIMAETLASEWRVSDAGDGKRVEGQLGDESWVVQLARSGGQ